MTCSKIRYEVTGSELIPKFAAPAPNVFVADLMKMSRVNRLSAAVNTLTAGAPYCHFCFVPQKGHWKIPPLLSGEQCAPPLALKEHKITMNSKHRENKFKSRARKLFQRRTRKHDRMLVPDMSFFHFADGWGRTFSKYDYARSQT
jgi:hypothetical protein